jgi:hypothetical protein
MNKPEPVAADEGKKDGHSHTDESASALLPLTITGPKLNIEVKWEPGFCDSNPLVLKAHAHKRQDTPGEELGQRSRIPTPSVLFEVNGVSVAKLDYKKTMVLLKTKERPIQLKFGKCKGGGRQMGNYGGPLEDVIFQPFVKMLNEGVEHDTIRKKMEKALGKGGGEYETFWIEVGKLEKKKQNSKKLQEEVKRELEERERADADSKGVKKEL